MVEEHVSPPVVVNTVQEQIQGVQDINMEDPSTYDTRKNTETSAHTAHEYNRTHINETSTQTIIEECVDPPIRANNAHEQIRLINGSTTKPQDITMQEQVSGMTASAVSTPFGYDSRHGSHVDYGTAANDVEAALSPNVDRINHMEYSFILSGENEKPFTYICSLLDDWGRQQDTKPYIQGKIKVHMLLNTLLFVCKFRNLLVPLFIFLLKKCELKVHLFHISTLTKVLF